MFFNLLHSSLIYLTAPLFPRGIREKTKPKGEPKWRKLNASKKETSKKITLCSNCKIFDRCLGKYFQLKDKIFHLMGILIFLWKCAHMRRKINFFACGENQIHVWAAELVQQAPLPNAHGSDQNLHAKIVYFGSWKWTGCGTFSIIMTYFICKRQLFCLTDKAR